MRVLYRLLILAVVAGLVGVALASVGLSEQTPEPVGFVVPTSRSGDRVTYQPQAVQEDDGPATGRTDITFAFGEPATMLDHDAVLRLSVPLQQRWQSGKDQFERVQHVSVSNREAFASSTQHEFFDALSAAYTDYDRALVALPGFHFQGASLTLGAAIRVPVHLESFDVGSGGGSSGGGAFGPLWMNGPAYAWSSSRPDLQPESPVYVNGTVVSMGEVADGPAAIVSLTYNHTIPAYHFVHPRTGETHVTYGATAFVAERYTFTAASPYASEIVRHVHTRSDDGAVRDDTIRYVKVDEAAGAIEIPWGADAPSGEGWARLASPGYHPGDGSGDGLPYRLEDAIADVWTAGTDPEWVAWRETAIEPLLIGATFTRGALNWSGQETWEWRLLYGSWSDGYMVRTERVADASLPIVEGMGAQDVPGPVWLEEGPMLLPISETVRLWRMVTGAAAGDSPDYYRWGYWEKSWSSSRYCVLGVWTSHGERPTLEDSLATATIGTAAHGPCYSQDASRHDAGVLLRLDRPTLLMHYDTVWDFAALMASDDGSPVASSGAFIVQDPKGPFLDFHRPEPEKAVLWGLPALFAASLLYFLPAAKYGVSQGLLLAGFSRLRRDRLLEQEQRDRLHMLVASNPGISPSALAKETEMSWNAVVHHLGVMERNGLLASRIEGRHRRFFVAEMPAAEQERMSLLANAHTQRFYAVLVEEPGLATGELAQRLGVTPPGALYQLQRLEAGGLIERRRHGRAVRYYPMTGTVRSRPYDPNEAVEVA